MFAKKFIAFMLAVTLLCSAAIMSVSAANTATDRKTIQDEYSREKLLR